MLIFEIGTMAAHIVAAMVLSLPYAWPADQQMCCPLLSPPVGGYLDDGDDVKVSKKGGSLKENRVPLVKLKQK